MNTPSQRFQKALEFAAIAHRDQVRKGTQIPYITHPVAVSWILREAGLDEDVVVAGLLHDVTEDAGVPLDDLRAQFGNQVARIVSSCSEPDKSLSWIQRKEHTIHQLETGDDDCRAVAAADKLHNVQCMLADFKTAGHALWSRFKQGMHYQAWYYGSVFYAIIGGAKQPEVGDIAVELYRVASELFGPHYESRCKVHPDRRRFITVNRAEIEKKRGREPKEGGDWLLAVDPASGSAKCMARRKDGFVPDAEGHEDLFPVEMAFEHPDGFLPGGDWVAARTPDVREHDGLYRCYFISWQDGTLVIDARPHPHPPRQRPDDAEHPADSGPQAGQSCAGHQPCIEPSICGSSIAFSDTNDE